MVRIISDKTESQKIEFEWSRGDSCEKCSSASDVQKFKGKMLCKSCRNQWASMSS